METTEKTKQTLSYTGTIVEFGDAVQGETWLKQDFTIRTNEEYPQLINFLTFNNVHDQLSRCKLEDDVIVYFNAKSRKYNNKWFTELSAWKIVINFKKKTND